MFPLLTTCLLTLWWCVPFHFCVVTFLVLLSHLVKALLLFIQHGLQKNTEPIKIHKLVYLVIERL